MMPNTRNESKEVIETIVLEPPLGSYEDEDSAIALSSSFATDSGRISAGPLLEKPRRVRLVSFKNQQELAEKLQGVMIHPTSGFITQEETLPKTSSSTATSRRRSRRSLSEQGRPKAAGNTIHKKTRSLPTKHCIVDLDEAYELYPAVSSISSLPWMNPSHCTCIRTTHGEDEGILAATTPSMSSRHKHQKTRSSRCLANTAMGPTASNSCSFTSAPNDSKTSIFRISMNISSATTM